MASGPRKASGTNKRPHLAACGRDELGELFWWHAASHHRRMNRFRMRQFDLIVHLLVDGPAPLFGQGGAKQQPAGCWGGLKAEESANRNARLSPQPPRLGPRPSFPSSIEEGSLFQKSRACRGAALPRMKNRRHHPLLISPLYASQGGEKNLDKGGLQGGS